nr:cobalamin biosynthesis protein CobG [Shimia sp. SK013]
MMSGDGLVVRVRPIMSRLTRDQILGLCATACQFGSGIIDLTSRSNLQIRGVSEANHEAVLVQLEDLALLPDDPALESRRNILVPPMWQDGDETYQIVTELLRRLGDLPELPAKMGYAVDINGAPQLSECSADFRFELASDGGLVLRADGASRGRLVTANTAVDAVLEMADWFVTTGGAQNRRMARHTSLTALPAEWQSALPAAPAANLTPGQSPIGAVFGVAFGQIEATELAHLVTATDATALRVTPWRLFLFEDAEMTDTSTFITASADPLLTIDACPGAPLCTSSSVKTREVARALAGKIKGPLHISGCSKGCARPRPCTTTLVGHNGAFDLVQNGTPWDQPTHSGLAPDTLIESLGEL